MGLPASATEAHDNAPVKDHHATNSAAKQVVAENAALNVPKAKAAKSDSTVASATTLKFSAEAAPEPAPEPEPETTTTTTTTTTADDDTTPSTTHHSDSDSSSTASTASTASSSASSSSAPSSAKGGSIVSIAARYVGVPYVYGGTTPSGWDCSGYVSYVYQQAGISIPRSSSAIRSAGTVVSASEARPGDIIWHPGHVGIYAGNGMMYDAGSPSSDTSHRSYSWMGSVTFLRF
nr:C40 family peptidase [Spelaeicoccus albus]